MSMITLTAWSLWDRRQETGDKHGFTLVEFLVVMTLMLVIGGGLLTSFLVGRTSYLSADAYIIVQQEARKAFNNMVRELRESATITCGTDTAFPSPPGVSCSSSGANARLNLQLVTGYIAGTGVTLGSESVVNGWVHYAMIGTAPNQQLIRWRSAAGTPADLPVPTSATCVAPDCRVLANNVKSVAFTATDTDATADGEADVVTVNIEVEYTNSMLPGGSMTTGVLSSSVKLRNT